MADEQKSKVVTRAITGDFYNFIRGCDLKNKILDEVNTCIYICVRACVQVCTCTKEKRVQESPNLEKMCRWETRNAFLTSVAVLMWESYFYSYFLFWKSLYVNKNVYTCFWSVNRRSFSIPCYYYRRISR